MSLFGSLTNFLTGGENGQAEEALNQAQAAFGGVKTPSLQDLTLPELQQYVQAGILTPAQAQAVLQQSNAYDNISTDPRAREASIDALTGLQSLGDSGAAGSPEEQAALAGAEGKMNQNLQSQRASIMDQMDQRGIPSSLMGVQAQLAAAGQDSEQAHQDALTAEANNANLALQALEQSGTLGTQISGQQDQEAQAKAAAQNAIDQWNAANQTTVNLNNAQLKQQTDTANLTNAQSVGNANTQNKNARTSYNAQLPQQVFADEMAKANAKAGISEAQAKQYTGVGEQNAGTAGAVMNLLAPQPFTGQSAGSTVAGSPGGSSGGGAAPAAAGGASSMFGGAGAAGGSDAAAGAVMLASHGGEVPGIPKMAGDSPRNDTQPAMLSPGEIVVPRTAAHDPRTALAFIKHLHRQTAQAPAHPDDVKSVLHALNSMRRGG